MATPVRQAEHVLDPTPAEGAVLARPERFSPVRIVRTAPARVWAVVALHALLLACWSVLAPQYHAPDEPNHVDAVMRLEQGKGWPRPGQAFVTDNGVGAIAASPFGTRQAPYSLNPRPIRQADAPPRGGRPTWDELTAPPELHGRLIQQHVQHPPLYYGVEAGILRLLPGHDGWSWDVTVGVLRLLSVLMVAPLPLLAWAGAHRLTGSATAGTAACVVPLAVPQLSHIGSTVNNDNLLALLGGLVTVAVVHVLRGDRSLRTAAWVGVLTGAALLTKALALVLVPMVAAAYLLSWWRARRAAAGDPPARPPLRPLALAGGLAVAAGGWWWAVNLLRYHTVQPKVPSFPPGKDIGPHNEVFLRYLFQGMTDRWWGSLGWYEVNLPWRLVVVCTALLIGAFVLALVRGGGWWRRAELLLMLWPTLALFGVVGAQAASHFHRTHRVAGLSGRYLFAGVVGIAVVVGAAAALLPARVARWAAPVLLLGALAVQAEAVRLSVRKFWLPPGGLRQAWGALSSWSPWPPLAVQIGVALAALACLAALAALLPRRPRPAQA